jgi:catechol 2,3-dioxygenase-like lactoylglutathione lyase family enzyme
MPKGYLEHANLTVSDPDRSAALLVALCGWHERWRGPSKSGGRTIHVGNEHDYIAFYAAPEDPAAAPNGKGQPLNHIAVVVDDLDGAEAVVTQAGLKPYGHDDYDPGRRFYFCDWDGIEFEVVTYG